MEWRLTGNDRDGTFRSMMAPRLFGTRWGFRCRRFTHAWATPGDSPGLMAGVAALLFAATSCYSPGLSRVINEPAPISESLRASFGRMALMLDLSTRGFQMRYPRSTSEAVQRSMTHTGHVAGKVDLDDHRELAGVVFLGVLGTVEALFTGVPRFQIDADAEELKRALRESPILPGLAEQLQSRLVLLHQEKLPQIPETLVGPLLAQPPSARDYRALTSCGCDSVMELVVYRQAFRAEGKGNPPMSFETSIHVYITRISDGALLFVQPFDYRTRKYLFGQWADRQAERFRAELAGIRADAAQAIIEQMFGP